MVVTPSIAEAKRLQLELRQRLVSCPPPGFAPRFVAGADLAIRRGRDRGYAAVVVLDLETMETVDAATVVVDVAFPYVPGYLSFRELPPLAVAWEKLTVRPDAVIFDGQGTAHPRRFGLACHGGVRFGVPSVGCAKSLLVGEHGPLGRGRGATSPIRHAGEVVGAALRTRTGVRPVYVSPGHMMDLDTAVALVLRAGAGYREPETTRRSHRLVTELRARAIEAGRPDPVPPQRDRS